MTSRSITLIGAANLFGVHPRTIVRALSGEHNTYWFEDINEDLHAIADIAAVYGLTTNELTRVVEGRDSLITSDEAAALLKLKPRTFRNRIRADEEAGGKSRYGRAACGNIVRYLKSKIIEHKIAAEE